MVGFFDHWVHAHEVDDPLEIRQDKRAHSHTLDHALNEQNNLIYSKVVNWLTDPHASIAAFTAQ